VVNAKKQIFLIQSDLLQVLRLE